MNDFDLRTVRLYTDPGAAHITAQCTLPGCEWVTTFASMIRLSVITETCAGHPCKSELINHLRTIVDMTPNEGMQLLRLLLARHDKAAEPERMSA